MLQTEVAPVSWTLILLARRRSPQCRSRDRRTRRHSDSRWSSWFGPDVHRESWLGSLSHRPRRYETGLHRLDRDAGKRSDGLSTEDQEELRRLRRENRRLREEREILTPLYVKKCFGQLIERKTSFGAAVSEATVVDCAYGRWSNVAAGPGVTSGERPYRQGRDCLCAGLRWPRTVCKRRSRVSLRIVTGFIHV